MVTYVEQWAEHPPISRKNAGSANSRDAASIASDNTNCIGSVFMLFILQVVPCNKIQVLKSNPNNK